MGASLTYQIVKASREHIKLNGKGLALVYNNILAGHHMRDKYTFNFNLHREIWLCLVRAADLIRWGLDLPLTSRQITAFTTHRHEHLPSSSYVLRLDLPLDGYQGCTLSK